MNQWSVWNLTVWAFNHSSNSEEAFNLHSNFLRMRDAWDGTFRMKSVCLFVSISSPSYPIMVVRERERDRLAEEDEQNKQKVLLHTVASLFWALHSPTYIGYEEWKMGKHKGFWTKTCRNKYFLLHLAYLIFSLFKKQTKNPLNISVVSSVLYAFFSWYLSCTHYVIADAWYSF